MSDILARIQLCQLEVDRLYSESQRCKDLERLTAIGDEIGVLLESMREIRREQLMEQLDPPRSERRRRWWQFWRASGTSSKGRDSALSRKGPS